MEEKRLEPTSGTRQARHAREVVAVANFPFRLTASCLAILVTEFAANAQGAANKTAEEIRSLAQQVKVLDQKIDENKDSVTLRHIKELVPAAVAVLIVIG